LGMHIHPPYPPHNVGRWDNKESARMQHAIHIMTLQLSPAGITPKRERPARTTT
jgi:hypothetical protein